ncbi:MAG: FG-GAP-like repeat-containing protein [Thermoplasmatota archaeon]
MGAVRRSSAALLVAALVAPLLALPLPLPGSRADLVTTFSNGSTEAVVELSPPAPNASLAIVLPEYSYVVESSLCLTTPGEGWGAAPRAPTLDLGGDGSLEWAFNGTGVGAFGHQTLSAAGESTVSLKFTSASEQTIRIRLPRGAEVRSAALSVRGELQGINFTSVEFTGSRPYDMFGLSVAGGADINRDGKTDIVVGAPGADANGQTDSGSLSVIYGPLGGPVPVPETVPGMEAGDLLGFSVAILRDFTGDGFGDVLAGAPYATHRGTGSPTPNTGVAYLFPYESNTGRLRNLPSRALPGLSTGGQMGFSVAEVPDLDGDGLADMAAGEILANRTIAQPYLGRVSALYSRDGVSLPLNLWGEGPYSLFGYCIESGQRTDFNLDGRPDFAVGSPLASPGSKIGVGAVYIFTGPGESAPTVIAGEQPLANFSASLAAGDFNGDGAADLAVGAPNMKEGNVETGAVAIYFAGRSGIDPLARPLVLWGPGDRSRFGASLACPGDMDGDGTDDLLVGAPSASRPTGAQKVGMVMVLLTGRNQTIPIWGEAAGGNFGYSLAPAGDVDGDGSLDFVVGSPTASNGGIEARGQATVFMTKLVAPLNPRINVGGLGADDWGHKGFFIGDEKTPDLSAKLNGVLSNPMPFETDEYGNELVEIPVVVSCDGPGILTLHNISIVYAWTAAVGPNPASGNLTGALNALLSHKRAEPPVKLVPLVLNSTTPGRVLIGGLRVALDEPPEAVPGRVTEMPEDTRNERLIDLYTVFMDDYDPDRLVFNIEEAANGSIVAVEVFMDRWLSADALSGPLNDNWTGEVVVRVSAADGRGLVAETDVRIVVTPVNDPPVISGEPPASATAGLRYLYLPNTTDSDSPEVTFRVEGAPQGMSVNGTTGEVRWTPSLSQLNQSYSITLRASDGELESSQSWTVRVEDRLEGVRFTSEPPRTVHRGGVYSYKPEAVTDVPDAQVKLNLTHGPEGMRLDSDGVLRWTASEEDFFSIQEAELSASDGFSEARQRWSLIVLEPGWVNSSFGCWVDFPDNGSRVRGLVSIRGSCWFLDETIMRVEVSVDGGSWSMANGTVGWVFDLNTSSLSNGEHIVDIRAWDGQRYSPSTSITIIVDNPSDETPDERIKTSDLLVGFALLAIVAAGASLGVYAVRRRVRGAAGAGTPASMAPAPQAPSLPPAPPTAPRAPDWAGGEEMAIEDVFLVYRDGRLIHHSTRRLATGVDTDILSSMLTALTSFVRDALSRTGDGTVGSLEYGGSKIFFEMGRWVYIAVVVTGAQEPPGLREEMRQAVRNIESEFGGVLPEWDGNIATLTGSRRLLAPLVAFRAAPAAAPAPAPEAVDVSVLGELEFFQGYVRLKVAVKNNSPSFIMDSAFKIIYNDKALKLERVEPDYPLSGREVLLGNIGIKEKKTIAFYLDPQICMESYIDGTLTFKDAQGGLHHADMKRKLASVVCPIMHTDENVNTAMLKRMLESELDQKDSKLFSLPPGLGPEKAFEVCKRAVQGHDIRLVREFEERAPTYIGEAWYFGKVKGRPEKLVVKAAVRADEGVAEFYVASNSRLVVTGLLAELKSDLNREYRREREAGAGMEAMVDPARRERLRREGTLLDKHSEAELGAAGPSGPSQGR